MNDLDKKLVTKFQATMYQHHKEVLDYKTAEYKLKELAELLRLTLRGEAKK